MPECRAGNFGADCLQKCHCKDNSMCAKDTGRCEGLENDCKLGYAGSNCQGIDHFTIWFGAETSVIIRDF